MNWYVLFVVGGEENRIKSFFNSQYEDWVAFYPMIQKIHRCKGKSYMKLRPMFPSYVFVKSEIDGLEKEIIFEYFLQYVYVYLKTFADARVFFYIILIKFNIYGKIYAVI